MRVPEGTDPILPVSVVIVNYNAGALLLRSVQAVVAQVQEVWVVDNASSDQSVQAVLRHFPNRVHVVRNARNRGFAAACNQGIRVASQPYVFFLNPDGIPAPGALARLLQVLQQHPQAGMVGGLLLGPDGDEQGGGRRALPTPWRALVRASGLYRLAPWFPRLCFDFHLHRLPRPQHPTPVEAVSGACMLVRREALEDVGLWDEGYFLHCEDLDWCARFGQRHWQILFVPDAPVVHHQGTCSRSRPVFVQWHKHRGMLRFYRKFFRHAYPGPLMGLVMLGVWGRFGAIVVVQWLRTAGAFLARGPRRHA